MDAPPSHPSRQALRSYRSGELDAAGSGAIRDHLATCPDCRGLVAGVPAGTILEGPATPRPAPGASTVANPGAGETLGYSPTPPEDSIPPGLANHPDYQVRRELGRGGMGVVYLAHNTMMGRDEVLKVMGRHIMERPGVLERFQREIRAVAQLRHPNIVAAYSAFRLDGGLAFAMEYVEGLDLFKLVQVKGPLAIPHAAHFVHQAALGLQHAHEKRMVHRDIKPHNLMLTREGKSNLVKVLDFGLAKAAREEKVEGGLTLEGQALGTPDYIAPEQILNATDVDIRADLYSLGGTLYYLLTGRPPFQATSLYDMYQAHISREAEPLNQVRPEVPAGLVALVSKMMAKDPAARFQTPSEVAQALVPYFRPKAATPPGPAPAPKPPGAGPVALDGSAIGEGPASPRPAADRRRILIYAAGALIPVVGAASYFLIRPDAERPALALASPPAAVAPKALVAARSPEPEPEPTSRPEPPPEVRPRFNPPVSKKGGNRRPFPNRADLDPSGPGTGSIGAGRPEAMPEPPPPAATTPEEPPREPEPPPRPRGMPPGAPKAKARPGPAPDPFAHVANEDARKALGYALNNTKRYTTLYAAENFLKAAEKAAPGDAEVRAEVEKLRKRIKEVRRTAR